MTEAQPVSTPVAEPIKSESVKTEPAKVSEAQKVKLAMVVNGTPVEGEYTHDELKNLVQMGMGASRKFEEAAEVKREVERKMKLLESDPENVFKTLGKDPKEWAETYLLKQLELAEMPEAERKNLEYERQLKEYQEKEVKAKEESEKTEYQKQVEAESLKFNNELGEALMSSGLASLPIPLRPVAARFVASTMLADTEGKISAKEAVKIVENDYMEIIKAMVTPENATQILGEDRVKALSEKYAKNLVKNNIETVYTVKKTPAAPSGRTWENIKTKALGLNT